MDLGAVAKRHHGRDFVPAADGFGCNVEPDELGFIDHIGDDGLQGFGIWPIGKHTNSDPVAVKACLDDVVPMGLKGVAQFIGDPRHIGDPRCPPAKVRGTWRDETYHINYY